jgi:hypothetical protein
LQLIKALAQLCLAKAKRSLLADHMMHCLKNFSRQLMFAGQFLEFGKCTFQATDLRPALHYKIYQRTNQKITLVAEAHPLTLVWYPLLGEDLKNLSDLLKYLASQAPALLALP